jgi:hypothetical protein
MTPTLRQAARLAEEISVRIRALSPALDVALSADETMPAAAVARARDKARRQEQEVRALEEVLVALRQAVGRANAETGISDLLAERAVLGGRLSRLEARAKSRPYAGEAQAEAALADLRAQRSASRFGGSDSTIAVPIWDAEEIESAEMEALACRRRLAEIGDLLAERNAGRRIVLPSGAEELLRRHGIAA